MYSLAKELAKLKKLEVGVSVKSRTSEEKDKLSLLEKCRLSPEPNGLILQIANDTPCAFAIVMEAPNRADLAVVLIEGRRSEMLTRLSPIKVEGEKSLFVRLVSTYPVFGGRSTKPQDNSFRIVSVRGGLLQIASVAVTTRLYDEEKGAYHFLVVQEMYKAKLYRDPSGKIVAEEDIVTSDEEYPGFNRWPVVQKLVDEMVPPAEREKLALLTKRRRNATPKPVTLGENEAEIIFFDINKGFGFARVASETGIYFNWQEASTDDRLPFFKSRQIVRYESVTKTPRGEKLVGVH